ncbi:NAD(P)-binding protein [Cylindrobasidium torrendii FP15055 ss-10]|uniref:NAD(P)-binding protein n=1 Tax=Cylindrobasidium torrendii FP15055 ss-10 TaxID=1314674 RepID=A0A0D7B4L6_9AGAR|nr:NAD(P)-binding protein [Cylindrobasidium torrendii FP15055 ss-10]
MVSQLVWIIINASTTLGQDICESAIARGDLVLATCAPSSNMDALKRAGAAVIELDTNTNTGDFQGFAERAAALHGRIDVVVNNLDYNVLSVQRGTTATADQINSTLFGGLKIARAFLPHMRRSSTVAWVGSIPGWLGGVDMRTYAAFRKTVQAVNDSLHREIAPLGLRSIYVDLGYSRTPVNASNRLLTFSSNLEDYLATQAVEVLPPVQGANRPTSGDSKKAAQVFVDVLHSEDRTRPRGGGGFLTIR